jgi:hypothetical protein
MTGEPMIVELDEMPYDARALVNTLDAAYPHRCIGPTEDLIQAHRRAGVRELIDHLLGLYAQQDEEDRTRQFEAMTP